MKYFVTADQRVFAYDDDVIDIPEGLTAVSEADALARVKLQPAQLREAAALEKQERINAVSVAIDILCDAVELGMATNEEKAAISDWKAYRVLLNRVDVSTAPEIDWPQAPSK